jgi:hypothetical protein
MTISNNPDRNCKWLFVVDLDNVNFSTVINNDVDIDTFIS